MTARTDQTKDGERDWTKILGVGIVSLLILALVFAVASAPAKVARPNASASAVPATAASQRLTVQAPTLMSEPAATDSQAVRTPPPVGATGGDDISSADRLLTEADNGMRDSRGLR